MIAGRGIALVCFDGSSDPAGAPRVAARLSRDLHAQVVHVWRSSTPEGARLAVSTVVDIAERAAVVVGGTRGRSIARRVLVGSVAPGVHQPCGRPVLLGPAPRQARKG